MASDLTDLFEAIYTRYGKFTGDNDAYTLTDGRLHRTQAPPGANFPCIVIAQVGGTISEMFSGDSLDAVALQFSVFAEFKNDISRASLIMRSLINIFNWETLYIPSTDDYIRMRREGMQQEAVEDRTHVHIWQDWLVESQVPAIT